MGSGSTVAAALALGGAVRAVGIERDKGFAALARKAIPKLAAISSS